MTKIQMVNFCNKIIEFSFYALLFFIPLAFASDTFELFEFNKMWLTFVLTIVIGASWVIKMILQRRVFIQRTPLDIPIALFLASQIISTIFSWDTHVSIWGYYSRFNGGLLSICSYALLFYAFVSNLAVISVVKRILLISLLSGLVVGLWGLPSHFGYDPTCFLFRGTFDVSCWTADFQPKVRIFSTLGQPSWLAAYLAILIPLSITMFLRTVNTQTTPEQKVQSSKFKVQSLGTFSLLATCYLLLATLFYLDLLYTRARSGVLAAWFSLGFFFIIYFWMQRKEMFKKENVTLRQAQGDAEQSRSIKSQMSKVLVVFVVLVLITFFVGQPFAQLERFTFEGIKKNITSTKPTEKVQEKPSSQRFAGELGGTDSGKIRLLVWEGAFTAWRNYPIFGTGVETFAFAYYRFRPINHNLTSEWNFLYNKAHNEYLNYLATTGTVGLGTYVLMIGVFLIRVILNLFQDLNSRKTEMPKLVRHNNVLVLALLTGYVSILITNFFGFSVVITNIYLFLIPAFVFVLTGMISSEGKQSSVSHITPWLWTFIALIIFTALYMLTTLFRYWGADKAYALGSNLNKAGEYQQAYSKLVEAVEKRSGEPVFKDELAVNNAVLATALMNQEETQISTDTAALANQLAQDAIALSDSITLSHPNNILFWKSRVRIFYTLSQTNPAYLNDALDAVKQAQALAPTDANISYNLGVLYGQNNETQKGIEALENTIRLKADYRDAYYALALFYHDQAVDENGNVVDREKLDKAIVQIQYILDNLSEDDKIAKETLEQWEKL